MVACTTKGWTLGHHHRNARYPRTREPKQPSPQPMCQQRKPWSRHLHLLKRDRPAHIHSPIRIVVANDRAQPHRASFAPVSTSRWGMRQPWFKASFDYECVSLCPSAITCLCNVEQTSAFAVQTKTVQEAVSFPVNSFQESGMDCTGTTYQLMLAN